MGTVNENIRARVSLVDNATPKLAKITAAIGGAALAWKAWDIGRDIVKASIEEFSNYESSMVGIKSLVETTGRSYAKTLEAMTNQMGGLASQAAIAETFLKGLTTELNVDQINELTTAVRNASIAMGEDFNVQLPLIIKAVKQLNPAILDNIGVTVRLDRVNKKITEGYYGMSREINEATQQNAIFQEIIKQTAKFQGMEATALDTTKGKMQLLSAQTSDLYKILGEAFNPEVQKTIDLMNDLAAGMIKSATAAAAMTDKSFIERYAAFLSGIAESLGLLSEQGKLGLNLMGIYAEWKAKQDALNESTEKGNETAAASTEKWREYISTLSEANQAIFWSDMWKQIFERQPAILQSMHDDYVALLDEEENQTDETAEYVAERWMDVSQKKIRALIEAAEAQKRLQVDMMGVMNNTMMGFSRNIVKSMKFLHTESTGVFKNMAVDFSRYFIEEVLRKMTMFLVPKMLGILGSIFDTRANDMMAMRQGADFGRFFKDGVIAEVNPDSMAAIFADATEFDSEIQRQNMTGGSNVAIY